MTPLRYWYAQWNSSDKLRLIIPVRVNTHRSLSSVLSGHRSSTYVADPDCDDLFGLDNITAFIILVLVITTLHYSTFPYEYSLHATPSRMLS